MRRKSIFVVAGVFGAFVGTRFIVSENKGFDKSNPHNLFAEQRTNVISGAKSGGEKQGKGAKAWLEPATDFIDKNPVVAPAPSPNQILKWDGSTWVPMADDTGSGAGTTYWTLTGDSLYPNTLWNVGIGTITPNGKLSIAGTDGLALEIRDGGDFYMFNGSNSIGFNLRIDDRVLWTGSSRFDWEGFTDYCFMDGDVGIGTTVPGAKLEVAGEVKITGGSPGAGKVLTSDASGLASWELAGGVTGSGIANYLARWTSATDLSTGATQDNGTSVGIGAGPSGFFRLYADGNFLEGGAIYGNNTTSGTATEGRGVTGNAGRISGTCTDNYGVYGTASGATTNYGVYGDVGGNPGYGVYGSGGAAQPFGYLGSGTYGVYCSGNGAYTGTWLDVSDQKFKKDVADYSGALENILKLKPRTYTMKTEEYPYMNFASGKQIGFIAQEMEQIFPTLVEKGVHPGPTKESPNVEYKGINYIGMVPVLVKAIQEQQAENNTLKTEIELLKSSVGKINEIQKDNETLKAELKEIKKMLGTETKKQ